MTSTYRLVEVRLPLARPFATARGSVGERRIVLVGAVDGIHVGWGEAAPYPGATAETVDDVWAALTDPGAELPPTAAAAVEEAGADLEARRRGEPLWARLGGRGVPVPAGVAIGGDAPAAAAARAAVAAGHRAVKVKVGIGDDLARVAAVRDAAPEISVGVDANGAYTWDDLPLLRRLDALGLAFVEQPFPPEDLEGHRRLRGELTAAVAVDEPIASPGAAARIVAAGAADLIVVKPSRLGPAGARAVVALAVEAGLGVRVSGLVETEVGRAHALAVATLPGVVGTDLARPGDVGMAGLVTVPVELRDGLLLPPSRPGIGVEPDPARLAAVTVRSAVVQR